LIAPMTRTDWADSGHQADYLIVASSHFAPVLAPLLSARQAQGLNSLLVPLEEVVDEFGDGAMTPDAIRRFLGVALEGWARPNPRYLLLVGDTSYDFKNYLGDAPADPLPSMMIPVAFGGETLSDPLMADTDDDSYPDLAVGRWPVSDLQQIDGLVQRTLAYESEGPTPAQAIFVADTSESTFTAMSDRLIAAGTFAQDPIRLYGGSSRETVGFWNDGAWLVNYVGHGSLDLWGKSDLLNITSMDNLLPPERPPLVTQFTCLTGFFGHPRLTSLAETMLLNPDGPVATIAATSLTLAVDQETFAATLIKRLADPSVHRIGDALLAAQRATQVTGQGGREVVATFHLLGDPALVIARPH
jgi:hypothetical protein